MENNGANHEFLDFINTETNKMLANLSSDTTQQAFAQFHKQWTQLTYQNFSDPSAWLNTVIDFQKQQINLWNQILTQEPSDSESIDLETPIKDLQDNIFDYIKKSYVITSNILSGIASQSTLDPHHKKVFEFYTKQYTDAMSPDNFAATNPEVIQEAINTNGQSLVDGLKNLMCDIEKGRISMTDETAFTLGKNIATSKGAIVYENELFQLIHYKPKKAQVYSRPMLIVPPCINKFYILDLQQNNSFVDYCLEQEQNLFMVSWVNPNKNQGHLSWDNYVGDGVIKAINVVRDITEAEDINTISWCVGGTLLASALAVLTKKKQPLVHSSTFLTTLLDFSQPGEISVFIDKPQVEALLKKTKEQGVLNGRQLSAAFNMLRSNDLIWSYVINNYLKGKQPPPFDILYWNGDSTNLPYEMYQFYITEMYLNNNLVKKNAIKICDQGIDLSEVDIPCYFLSTIGDHIAPWRTSFKGTQLLKGDNEFVLGASGHIAGVINPPAKKRRHYWVNNQAHNDADQWLKTATKQEGSWWPHWQNWLTKQLEDKIDAPSFGSKRHPVIEEAPGRYVKVSIEDMED